MIMDKWFQFSKRSQSPFPNYLSMESTTLEMKRVAGCNYQKIMIILQNNDYWLYFLENDFQKAAKKILKKIKRNPTFFHALITWQKKCSPSFLKNTKKNASGDLRLVNNKMLIKFYKQYEKEYKIIYSHYFPILSVEKYLTEYLTEYLLKEYKDQKIASDYFNKLLTVPSAMVNLKEKIEALKLAAIIIQNKKWLKIFKSLNTDQLLRLDLKLYRLIKNHAKRWFWLTRGYDGEILTFNDFINRIKKHIEDSPVKALQAIQEKNNQLKEEVKKIKIDKKYKPLFQAMRDGMHLKELRKSIVSQSLHWFDPILKEIARRGGISHHQAKFLRASDVREMLLKDKDFTYILNERIKLSMYLITKEGTKIIVGKQAENYFKKFCQTPNELKEIKGLAASPGVARGKAKIVLSLSEANKVKKGDVVITVNAEPSFSTAIIKAAALIADSGTGITSHPATLAREAGIPCVVDAKIATKILIDGDLIEVDGYKGIIRKIC
ncbi:MAG: Phosphoenolpyruvate synthase/pyruvate phosphate dikinase [Parcubacteria group bacterium GW2011_GWA2_39_18]|nr:MAG: Phosphoenolpyruvate synthase/pyruvate phosphate dikinase [Parcubacteria group bacterium GW2011_GWA2_39_18]